MRSKSVLLSMLVLFAMVLAACGGAEETTTPGATVPPVTMEATPTDDMTVTEVPTMEGTATDEPGVPVTGDVNPARVSNQLDFSVWTQDGMEIGQVEDMILDLDDRSVAYVIVNGIAVPWDLLELQAATGAGTGTGTDQATSTPEAGTGGTGTDATATADAGTGTDTTATADAGMGGTGTGISAQENAFILLVDEATFSGAPAFDPTTLPEIGQPATGWDATLDSYWQGGGAGTGQATADPNATTDPNATATEDAGADTGQATATQDAGADQGTATQDAGTGTDMGMGQALQGVMLASDLLGGTLTMGMQGQSTDRGTGQATADPNATTDPNATVDPNATADAGTDGTGTDQSSVTATIEDLIVDTDAGDILYVVVSATFTDGERLIPVPLSMFQWDAAMNGFILNADGTMLQSAPSFENGQVPDTTTGGWNSEFDSFWQENNGGTGSGGAEATATP